MCQELRDLEESERKILEKAERHNVVFKSCLPENRLWQIINHEEMPNKKEKKHLTRKNYCACKKVIEERNSCIKEAEIFYETMGI